MRYTITKIRNGMWLYENEKGIKTHHSTRYGAEKMALDVEHFHSAPQTQSTQELDNIKSK